MDEASVELFLATEMAPNVVVQEGTDDNFEITAVHFAALHSNATCLRQLLLFGADPTSSARDNQGRSMPTLAFAASRPTSDEHALPVLQMLIDAGCDSNAMADYGGHQEAVAVFAIQNVSLLNALLKAGANPEAGTIEPPPRERKTLLMLAVFQEELAACGAILDAGANIDACSADGSTALMDAAFNDNEECVELLIERGAHIDLRGDNQRTALIIGATNAVIARQLLEAGADPNTALDNGISPLSRAIQEEDPELVELLETFGASPDRLPGHAQAQILQELNSCVDESIREHFASTYGTKVTKPPYLADDDSPATLQESITAVLGPPTSPAVGDLAKRLGDMARTDPKVIQIMRRASDAIAGKDAKKAIKQSGQVLREKDDSKDLATASAEGDIERVADLLDQGIESDDGVPGFAYAIVNDQSETFEVYVQKGVDVTVTFDWTNSDGSVSSAVNGLIVAVAARSDWALKRMLELGIDPGHETPKHETALTFAIATGYREAQQLLFGRIAGLSQAALTNTLSFAAGNGNTDAISHLLAAGAQVNSTVFGGWSSLKRAVNGKHFDAAKLLLEHGADCNLRDDEGWSPLLNAIENRDIQLVKLLLAHGADPNTAPPVEAHIDGAGFSALMRAAHYGEDKILELLIVAGADLGQADAEGSSAIHYAAMHRHPGCIARLLEFGAGINSTNSESYSPLALFLLGLGPVAAIEGDIDEETAIETLELLLENGADWNAAAGSVLTEADDTRMTALDVAILGTELLELPRLSEALSHAD